MKRCALVTLLLYVAIMASLVIPVVLVAFAEDFSPVELAQAADRLKEGEAPPAFYAVSWAWIGTMALAQLGLLVVPVRLANRRPVTKRWIVWPVLASLGLLAMLVTTMCLAVWEYLQHTPGVGPGHVALAFSLVGAVWLLWTFLFGFYTGTRQPRTFMARVVRFLLAGSILELLVAVPAHVVARTRNYCCAGFYTFWGLAAGISVMLVAFGPATFALFARRWQSVRRPAPASARPGKTARPAPAH